MSRRALSPPTALIARPGAAIRTPPARPAASEPSTSTASAEPSAGVRAFGPAHEVESPQSERDALQLDHTMPRRRTGGILHRPAFRQFARHMPAAPMRVAGLSPEHGRLPGIDAAGQRKNLRRQQNNLLHQPSPLSGIAPALPNPSTPRRFGSCGRHPRSQGTASSAGFPIQSSSLESAGFTGAKSILAAHAEIGKAPGSLELNHCRKFMCLDLKLSHSLHLPEKSPPPQAPSPTKNCTRNQLKQPKSV